MDARPLRVNRLDRWSKDSQLLLEVYDHCEVPAGCGGVVLRWSDPEQDGWRVQVRLLLRCQGQLTLDGQPPRAGVVRLRPGAHVLGLELTELPPPGQALFCLGLNVLQAQMWTETEAAEEDEVLAPEQALWSMADGTWRYLPRSAAARTAGWTEPGYDDAEWLPLTAAHFPEPGAAELVERSSYERLRRFGAQGLAVTQVAEQLLVRRQFEVGPEGLR